MITTYTFHGKTLSVRFSEMSQSYIEHHRGGNVMNPLLIANWILFLVVVTYGLFLFGYLLKTRYEFVKMGKQVEFDNDVKARLHKIWVYVFGQKKLLKDKKSGIIHVMFFYGFILVQLGAIDFIWKGLKPGSHLPL